VVFYFWTDQRPRCVYYFATMILILVFTNITKLGYHDPRPFWVWTDVQAFACSSQYGNPSGHSSMSMGMAVTMALDFASQPS
jgi:membrane-associated phospholipid phosphatase